MSFKKLSPNFLPAINYFPWLIFLFFILWCFSIKSFLLLESALSFDAVPYYEHIRFFTYQLAHGHYPLWDPSREYGVPNEFYLRRIGDFNPVYSFLILWEWLKLNPEVGYMIFLAGYFFLGCIGFYFLSKIIFKEKHYALLSYVLFLFSSFGTTMFKSFMVFLFVPMVWFLYFSLKFLNSPSRKDFLGVTFCLMILMTTYIPFYFLTLILILFILCLVIQTKPVLNAFNQFKYFLGANKFFVTIGIILFSVSLLPAIMFYQDFKSQDLMVTHRLKQSANVEEGLAVSEQSLFVGGTPLTLIISRMSTGFENFQAGRFYLPCMVFIFLLLGFLTKITRFQLIIFLWGLMCLLISLYEATPIYPFLFKHIFFFKYFRNFQFFLWLAALPVIVLLAVSHIKDFIQFCQKEGLGFYKKVFVSLLCVIYLVVLFEQGKVLITTIITISFFIAALFLSSGFKKNNLLIFVLIFISILEPLNVFAFLKKNSPQKIGKYEYTTNYKYLFLPSEIASKSMIEQHQRMDLSSTAEHKNDYYMNSRAAIKLRESLGDYLFNRFFIGSFGLFSRAESSKNDYQKIISSLFWQNEIAYVSFGERLVDELASLENNLNSSAGIVTDSSTQVRVLSHNINELILKTNFQENKFLVWFNHYNPKWKAFLDDNKKVHLFQAQGAFKAVVVPSGGHVINFRFGSFYDYAFKFFILIVFYSTFLFLIVLIIRERDVCADKTIS